MDEVTTIRHTLATERVQEVTHCLAARMLKPATVARRPQELARDAWSHREGVARYVAENAAFARLAGRSADDVRTMYHRAAQAYADLLHVLDFRRPVEHLWSVTGRDVEAEKRHFGKSFVRLRRDRWGQQYLVYLTKLQPDSYEAESALNCAVISQDWPLAESLARDIPIPLSTRANSAMTLSLLRYTVLGRKKQIEERCKNFSSRSSGIDFPPRRPDFALAVVRQDEKLLAKALKGTLQSFREKWRLDKYVTPRSLKRYGSREKALEAAANQLCGLRWAYSTWGVVMMCLAVRAGLRVRPALQGQSDFLPQELYLPAGHAEQV
jgi:hypothetical protein